MKKMTLILLTTVLLVVCLASCDSLKHEHVTADEWSQNEESHWKNVTCTWDWCKLDIVTEAHVDADENNVCDVCDYEIPTKHEHTYDYVCNEDTHTKVYTCGCTSVKDEAAEEHQNFDADLFCDICGYDLSALIKGDIEWHYSPTHHWWEPETLEAGVVYDFGEHVDENEDRFCDVCRMLMVVKLPVDYTIVWSYNATHHWWDPQASGSYYGISLGVLLLYQEHSDSDNDKLCDVCRCYMNTIELDIEWQYSPTHHWWIPNPADGAEIIGVVYGYGEHVDENQDDLCDVCGYYDLRTDPETFYFSKLAGLGWLETLSADEVVEIKMTSQASGVAPGSFRYISSSTDRAPIARILEEYRSLEVFSIENMGVITPGCEELTVEFILQDGTTKTLSFTQNIYSDNNGNHFGVTHIPTFNDVPEFTSYLGFVSYEPTGWVMAYSDGDAEVLRRVCTIPLDELEFTPCIITGGLPTQPTNYPYFVQTEFGDLVFLYNDLFYIAGKSECGYYQLVGKNLDELVGEYCEGVYTVTMNDAKWLYEDLKPLYEVGEQVSVKIRMAYDLGYLLLVNGKKIAPVHTMDTEYWEFIFTMPPENVVINFCTYDGFLPNMNYAVLIESFWEKIPAADSVSVLHYYGEYASGAIVAMMVCSEYDFTEAEWDEEVGHIVIHYNNGNRILVLYEDSFYTLTAAYAIGCLTDEDVLEIAKHHKEFYPFVHVEYQ